MALPDGNLIVKMMKIWKGTRIVKWAEFESTLGYAKGGVSVRGGLILFNSFVSGMSRWEYT